MADTIQPAVLPGYERDISNLIDFYSLLAHEEQCLSFQSFKQFFKQGCYAYIHQAYWGCEHSPEYVQLLFASALDRLDIPSPTSPATSPLWHLHQLVPKPSGAAGLVAQPPTATQAASAAQGGPLQAPGPEQMQQGMPLHAHRDTAQQQQQHQQQQQQPPWLATAQATGGLNLQAGAEGPTAAAAQHYLHHPPGWLQHSQLQVDQGSLSPAMVHIQQQHEQQQQPRPSQHVMPQRDSRAIQQQQEQQQQQQMPSFRPDASSPWLMSPLIDQQQQQQQTTPQTGLDDPMWQLPSPPPLPLPDQHQPDEQGPAAMEGVEEFMAPLETFNGAERQQQQRQGFATDGYQQLTMHSSQHEQQHHHHHHHHQQQHLQDNQLQQRPIQPQLQGAALQPQQQQQDGDEDDFLADLFDILDEATQDFDSLAAAATSSSSNYAQTTGPQQQQQQPGGSTSGSTQHQQQPLQQHLQQQQQLMLQIPLVVKGAVVFTLLALHESQLNIPKVPIYTPLPLLKQLAAAAAEFRAVGSAASDALRALHMLTTEHRLLVGQFRRPVDWEPQLPPWLMPGGRLPKGLGLNTAIGVAARKAAQKAARSAMRSAAVAAAARAARGARGFDPGVHREAMFHIKTALRGLSNFTSMQAVCDSYARARRAIFEPLISSNGSSTPASNQQQQQADPGEAMHHQQQHQQQQESSDSEGNVGQEVMVVRRGGSRRKRKAAGKAAPPAASKSKQKGSQAEADAAASQSAVQQPSQSAAAPVDPPGLFDSDFAVKLQQLANNEASRMMLLLDPFYNSGRVRRRAAEQQRAAKAAEAAAAAAAREKLARFKQLTMARDAEPTDAEDEWPAAAAAPRSKQQQRQQQQQQQAGGRSNAAAAAAGAGAAAGHGRGLREELLAAGVLSGQDLEQSVLGGGAGGGLAKDVAAGASQVLQRQAQRQQNTLLVAEEWLRAQDALMDDEGGEEDDDMP